MGTKVAPERGRRPHALPVILTVVMLVLAVLAAGFMGEFSAEPVLEPPVAAPEQQGSPLPTTTATAEPLRVDGERLILDGGTAAAVLLVLLMAGLALLVRFLLRFRPQQEPDGGFREQTDLQQPDALVLVAEALPVWTEAASAALRTDSATSDAVIRCWLDFERRCADAGMPRTPAQTTSDFAGYVSSALELPPEPLSTLNRLYQRARFGRTGHGRAPLPLEPADREAAAAAIRELSGALDHRAVRR